MSYSTTLVFFYGVEETPELRARLRTKTVLKDVSACGTLTCRKGLRRACEKCAHILGAGDNFCRSCGTSTRFEGKFCRFCAQEKVTVKKSVTQEVTPTEAYKPRGYDDQAVNHILASFPAGEGIYIGRCLGYSYDCRDEAGTGFEVPEVSTSLKDDVAGLLKSLQVTDEPKLLVILQVT